MPTYRSILLKTAICATAISLASAATPATPSPANSYLVHNLVSDLPDTADFQDPNLINPWGIATTATSPFWLSNNGSGTSTLYGTTGAPIALVVTVPTTTGPTGGAATGIIANATTSFPVATGKAASFIFCTEDGTISGWNSSVNATVAIITVDNTKAGSVFKGCVTGGTAAAPVLYATDFHNGVVDMFDANFKPIASTTAFVDSSIPAGFAPFGIANLGGKIYVSYAKQDAAKHDDVAGAGNGYVDVFDASGTLITQLISKGALNSPWGMQIAPSTFGQFSGALLVGNFGDGTINAFDSAKGTSLGALKDSTGHTLTIAGLWGLLFGNGGRGGDTSTLYFTAGIPGPYGEKVESHGLFGSIQAPPSFTSTGVVNGASFQPPLAPNTWAMITGGGLAASSRSWASTDLVGGNLPTSIDNVGVTLNGVAAQISFVGPSQIDFLVPANATVGQAQIQVTSNEQVSAVANVNLATTAPGLFYLTGNKYVVSSHANGTVTGPTTLIPGSTTPIKAGETISIFGTGLTVNTPGVAAVLPTVTIGGQNAQVTFAGQIDAGVTQINVVVPAGLPSGDAAVVASIGGAQSQANAFLSVQ